MLKKELRALLENFLLPGIAALLPWPIAMAILRRLAAWRSLYSPEWVPAQRQALALLPGLDAEAWARDFRLTRLIDHADYWVSRTRARFWLRRHLVQVGDWPAAGAPAVGVFFHWGPHLWAVHALHRAGHRSAVLAGHFSKRSMGDAWSGFVYGVLRLKELRRASGIDLIFAPGTVQRSLAILAAGDWVIGTPDVPPSLTRLAAPVTLFGRPAWLPSGLVEIARRAQVPLVQFACALDLRTGHRELRIEPPLDPHDPQVMQRIADRFEALLREKPAAWSLWAFAPAFFVAPPAELPGAAPELPAEQLT
jgi:hypothetical protein